MKINYDLWNTTGESITIPDGVTTTWPEGDALVGNFVYNQGKLAGFVNTSALVANSSNSTTFPYDYVNITVDKSLEGVMTFNGCAKPEYLNVTYTESVNTGNTGDTVVLGTKYLGCRNVNEIKAIDPDYLTNDIVDGVWKQSLADLKYGRDMSVNSPDGAMFFYIQNLTSFNSNLDSLIDGEFMFYGCYGLTEFKIDMKSLVNAHNMFYECPYLEIFESDMRSLTNGNYMFTSGKLRTFTSNLKSLTNGYCMFGDSSSNDGISKLDTNSVKNIADTINDVSDLVNGNSPWDSDVYKIIHIGIANTTPNIEETNAFNTIASKGWTVYVIGSGGNESQWNPTSLTPLDGEEITTPIPFWAKPVPSDEEHAQYTDSEGNFYNILGAQFIYGDNLENYGMFISEEDAAVQMRLKKIGEEEIETA